jgi:hypothetical protein
MMNAGSKPASNSAILIFADARQLTNGIAEAHDHSILADVVRPDQRFLLSPHGSTSHARPIARTALKALTWKSSGGQGRALSAHRAQESYEGYAKRNLPRALSATRKRYAHVLANASETKRQNEVVAGRQNENQRDSRSA